MPETQYAAANGLKLAYETFGDAGQPPVLLIMGLGTQMIAWPDEMCELIAGRGFFVIRYDNRDIGLSTHLDELPTPSMRDILLRRKPPYKVSDMAEDGVALLDELGIDSAHVVGASMGGFIAQIIAGKHPDRVRSLTLIMTSTGSRLVGYPRPQLIPHLFKRRVIKDRAGAEEAVIETFALIGSKGYALDEDYLRDLAGRSYERSLDRRGYLRQLAAVMAQRNRTNFLRDIKVPTLVMHGLDDPLVNVSGGLALAKHIRGAQFVGFKGMGHDLPRELWPQFAEEICDIAARGEKVPTT
ncbi:MAG TPA: alpha/beta hydrolase [Mycobacteriales bacterium]|nr:alpha/beta hydrolase [Mycobacteriales bacterium]